MPKKSARPPVATLVRAFVDRRLAEFTGYVCFSAPTQYEFVDQSDGWEPIVEVIRARRAIPAAAREAFEATLENDAVLDAYAADLHAHAEAAFLVGLELGRRFGGAR